MTNNLEKEQEQVKNGVTAIMTILFESSWSFNVMTSIIENVIASVAFNVCLDSKTMSPDGMIDAMAKLAKEKIKHLEECKNMGEAKSAGIIDIISKSSDTIN